MINAVTEDYYYSLMLTLHSQGDLSEKQIDHLISLKAQLEDCTLEEAGSIVGEELYLLPDREELRKQNE